MFKVEISQHAAMIRMLEIRGKAASGIEREAQSIAFDLQARVKSALSGEVLNVKTGFLRSHVFEEVKADSTSVVGQVFTSGVKYARPNEYGTSSPYEIRPRNAKALHWVSGGADIFRRGVIHPPIKERSFMRMSLRDMRDQIVERLQGAIERSAR